MSYQLFQLVSGLGLGLGIAVFHRPIADFMLQQERALAAIFYAKGLPRPPLPTESQSRNMYFALGSFLALIEAGRLSEANGMDLVKLRDALLISSGASDALKNWENVSFLWALKDM